jgi:tRNA threonylcarbamoyladenosine biosynthesis protein TsaE
MPAHLSVELPDEAATLQLGEALAAGVAPGRVLTLRGPLGSGKTTLVRGLLRALGYQGRVKSPSYTLVELYMFSSLNLYHFDFYRFKDRSEWLNSGFRDYFNAASACIVEWPERVAGLLGRPDLEAQIAFALPGRSAALRGETSHGRNWVDAVRRQWSRARSP